MGQRPHIHPEVTSYRNRKAVAWIGRGGPKSWPPRSPDLTPLDFSVWRYVKDKIYVPLLRAILEEIRTQKTEAFATTDEDIIHYAVLF
jgi:hypothetical protein